jgi:hypothetical protein
LSYTKRPFLEIFSNNFRGGQEGPEHSGIALIDYYSLLRRILVVTWVLLGALIKMFSLPFLFTVLTMKQSQLNKTVVWRF